MTSCKVSAQKWEVAAERYVNEHAVELHYMFDVNAVFKADTATSTTPHIEYATKTHSE